MEHPLIGNLDHMNQEQVAEKINELYKKLAWATRSGNGHLCEQLRMALDNYQNRSQAILAQQIQQDQGNAQQYFNKIDIS